MSNAAMERPWTVVTKVSDRDTIQAALCKMVTKSHIVASSTYGECCPFPNFKSPEEVAK